MLRARGLECLRGMSAPAVNLPSAIRACLFDLDGVLTQTATVHAAAWKEMFDDFLRDARRARRATPFVAVRPGARLRRVRRRQAALRRRPRRSSPRAASSCPRARPTTRRTRRRCTGSATARTSSSSQLIRSDGVEAYAGSVRYVQRRARRRAAPRGRLVERQLPRRAARRPGSPTSSSARVDGVVAEQRAPARASRRPTRSSPRRAALGVEPARGGGVRGRAGRRRGRAGGRLRLRRRRRPRRPGRRAARARRRRRRRATSPSCCERRMIDHPDVRRRALVACARPQLDLDVLAQTESVFALVQRAHRAARQPRRGRAARPARAPTSTRSTSCARCRTPRPATATRSPGQTIINVTNGKLIRLLVDDEPFDVRYGELRRHERVLDLRAGVLRRARRVGLAGRHGGARPLDAAGLVHPARGRRDPLRGRAARRAGARRRAVRARGQRAAARRAAGDPRAAAALDVAAAVARSTSHHDPRRRAGPPHAAQRAADGGRRWTTWSTGPSGTEIAAESRAGPRARHGHRRPRSRARRLRVVKFLAYGWSSQRSLPALRDQVAAALAAGPAHRLGRAARRAARLPRRLLGPRRRRDRRRRRAAAGGALRALPRRCRPARAPSGARSPPRASPAPATTATRSGTPRRFVLPGAHVHRARRGRATRCAGATSTLDARPRARRAARPRRRGVPVADDPRRRSARATGRRARRRSTSTPTSPTPCVRYVAATGDDDVRARGRARAARRDGAAVALARPPRRRRGASASTASPAPTSTARSPTTTSTPTSWRSGTCAPPPTPSRAIPRRAAALGVDAEEAASWRDAADDDASSRSTRRSASTRSREGFTEPRRSGTSSTRRRSSTRCCCTSRTSTSTASRSSSRPTSCSRCTVRGDAFTDEEKARNFAYYEALTVRDSSLSACTQAVIAAEVGHLDLAYDYFAEAALIDLRRPRAATPRDGLHIASLAGAWIAAVAGLRRHARPRRRAHASRRACRRGSSGSPSASLFRGRRLRVEVDAARGDATRCSTGEPLEIAHHGETITISVARRR